LMCITVLLHNYPSLSWVTHQFFRVMFLQKFLNTRPILIFLPCLTGMCPYPSLLHVDFIYLLLCL
jgi:hypothetical protein